MKLSDFSIDTWKTLQSPNQRIGGYPSITIAEDESVPPILHLFKDHSGHFHLAIEAPGLQPKDLHDPEVNGLQVLAVDYRFHNGPTTRFIDVTLNISAYLEEFTEVVREIARAILEKKTSPLVAVENIIRNWVTFWGNASKYILSEGDQIGLICELLVLNNILSINPIAALNSWRGPFGESHDFSFPEWSFEVKGTQKKGRIHTVNGIDQLLPPLNKKLAFGSFLVSSSQNENATHLPTLINLLIENHLQSRPDLIVRFTELLAGVGYSPVDAAHYANFGIEVIDSTLFQVVPDFPALTSAMLNKSLSSRISQITYEISLEGMSGVALESINWGDYLF